LEREKRNRSRLKALELQGYKTFVSKHDFEFAPTITVFVGPNGSGKSNIADSIRWVLGEQSYSLLRGKRTEDMIFSGSETRPRAGMAIASIVFDNEDGWLPIDFSEVKISRRAYRDGVNEYFLNGQKVRLKEVSELLANCGLAQRTYTIVGQGLVDAVLSLNPNERRKLFEEAAGIGLYRARKEEALRRMESTRRNLERVQDIIIELEPRLRSLERQAKRVQEYELVREDILAALRIWYGYHWFHLRDRVIEAREQARLYEQERNQLRQGQIEVERELFGIRSQAEALRTQLHQGSQEISQLYRQREEAGKRFAVAFERRRWLREQHESLEAETLALTKSKGQLDDRIRGIEQELQGQRKMVLSAEQAFHRFAQDSTEKKVRTIQPSLTEPDRLRQQIEAVVAQKAATIVQIEQFSRRQDTIHTQLNEWAKDLEKAETILKQIETREHEILNTLQATQESIEASASREADLRQTLSEIQGELGELWNHQAALQREGSVIATRLELLRAASQHAKLPDRSYEWAKGDQIKGSVSRLDEHLRVASGYEAAISAALGDFRNALAFSNVEDLHEMLIHLGEEKGRLSLLALSSITRRKRLRPLPDPDCLGNAADFAEANEGIRAMVDSLLGHTLVVRDRQSARRLQADLPSEARIVTLGGDLFYPEGHVSLDVADEPWLRHYDLERLQNELADLEKRLAEVEDAIAQMQANEAEMKEEHQAAIKTLENARLQREDAQIQLEKKRLEREHAEEYRNSFQVRMGELRDESATITTEQALLNEKDARLAAERVRLQQDLQHALSKDNLGQQRVERLQAEMQLGSARRTQEDLEDRCHELTDQLAGLDTQLADRSEHLTKTEIEIRDLERESTEFEKEVKEIDGRIEALNQRIQPEEETLARLEERRASLEAEEGRLRGALRKAEGTHSEKQIELARLEEELGTLRRRIEEDFGLVSFEFEDGTIGQEPLPLQGLVERLQRVEQLPEGVEKQLKQLRTQLRRVGVVNPEAKREYAEVRGRVDFLTSQMEDSRQAEAQIQDVIDEMDQLMERDFRLIFEAVAKEFRSVFTRLFGGGEAELILTDPDDFPQTGIDIEARLPGRREQGLAMLSGGERSLTACALIFSLMKVSPTPFCVLDEVDAMLDDVNVIRFREMLEELCQDTQFVVITHNRETVQAAEVIYGVTMGADSASQVISLRMEEAESVLSR
jgi:chromosome segregation protein